MIAQAIFFIFYNFIFTPIAIFTLVFLLPFNKKLRQSLQLRKLSYKKNSLSRSPIWIHASSGEFEYAKPIITQIKRSYPDEKIMVTYSSPSYASVIESYPGVDLALPAPLDTPSAPFLFIKKHRPKTLLIARTDLWPQTLKAARTLQIPTLLFSCTMRPLSGFRLLFKLYYKVLFNLVDEIYCVSDFDKENILNSGCKSKVDVKGDTRFDQVIERIRTAKVPDLISKNERDLPTVVAGSTWNEDEVALLPALADHLKNDKARLILVPHELETAHLMQLEKKLETLDLSYSIMSRCEEWTTSTLVVDQKGILAELYLAGNLAFVGGSFKGKVHSVMEPLAAGNPTVVGPFYKNNREATILSERFIKDVPLVTTCENPEKLKEAFSSLLSKGDFNDLKPRIKEEVNARAGATRHVLSWLKSHISMNDL